MRYLIIHKDLRIEEQHTAITEEQKSLLAKKELRILLLGINTSFASEPGQYSMGLRHDLMVQEVDHLGRSWIFYDIEERDKQLELEQQRS